MLRPITIKEERIWRSIAHTDEEQSLRRLVEIDNLTALEAKMRISPRDKLEVPLFSLTEQLWRVFLCRVDENDSRCFCTRDELVVFRLRRVPVVALAPFPLNNASTNSRERAFVKATTHANEEGELFAWLRPSSWPDVKDNAFEERGVPFFSPVENHLHNDMCRTNVGSGGVQMVGMWSRAKETSIAQLITGVIIISYRQWTTASGSEV